MSGWNWLKDGVGGGVDFLTGGLTDFDQKGRGGYNWIPGTFGTQFNPVFGGDNKSWAPEKKFGFEDAVGAFTKGYMGQMGPGSSTPGGSQFLSAYTQGKGATPSTSSPVSTGDIFTGGGQTHSFPGVVISEKPNFYAFKNQPEYPAGAYFGGGGEAPEQKKPNRLAGALTGALGGFQAGGIPGAILGGIGGLFSCDERVKVDIEPLITTEVNDDLAQAAFFVKELRECS